MDVQISNAINQIIDLVKSIANPIAVLSLAIMGLYLLLGSDTQTLSKVKKWAISIAVGLILINLANPIVTWLQSIK